MKVGDVRVWLPSASSEGRIAKDYITMPFHINSIRDNIAYYTYPSYDNYSYPKTIEFIETHSKLKYSKHCEKCKK